VPAGTVLTRYSITLSEFYGIPISPGPRPQPVQASLYQADIQYESGGISTDAKLAPLKNAQLTYNACAADTQYENLDYNAAAGSLYCFYAHGLIAGARVTDISTYGSSYVDLSITIWQG
jgi:hypothetical protein